MNAGQRNGYGSRAAFTVLELLVAAGITALLAGFIAVVVQNVSVVWARSGDRLGTDSQARIVLDQLQLDLQGALYRDDGNVRLAADVLNNTGNSGLWQAAGRNPKPATNLSLQMTQPDIANARFGVAGVWLRFFTTSRGVNNASTPASISAPVAVGYQLIRRFTATNPANLNTAYLLHRTEVRPGATGTGGNARPGVLESGYDLTAAAYGGNNAPAPSNNNGSNPADPRAIRTPGGARVLDAVIADNVIDFGVRCYVRDASVPGGLRLIFPANASGRLSNATNTPLRGKLPSNTPPTAENYMTIFPDVIDVMVRFLTDQGAMLIANMERVQTPSLTAPAKYNSNFQEWWWGVAQENSRVYTRRIVINAKPL